jgi:ribosomal protein L11 methyltransferase
VEVSEKIIIKPTWREYGNREDKIIIEIDPKMAFGTGYHETTRLVLRALEKYIFPGCKMLDIGTGTGILAIASIKLGASKAIGIDTDEWSYQNAIENAIINNVADKFSAILGTIDNVDEDEFDIIAANINRNTILEILDKISTKLKSRGIFILSGILTSDKRMTEERLKLDGFELLEILSENEWIAMVSRK